jgi:hypothetical protein
MKKVCKIVCASTVSRMLPCFAYRKLHDQEILDPADQVLYLQLIAHAETLRKEPEIGIQAHST